MDSASTYAAFRTAQSGAESSSRGDYDAPLQKRRRLSSSPASTSASLRCNIGGYADTDDEQYSDLGTPERDEEEGSDGATARPDTAAATAAAAPHRIKAEPAEPAEPLPERGVEQTSYESTLSSAPSAPGLLVGNGQVDSATGAGSSRAIGPSAVMSGSNVASQSVNELHLPKFAQFGKGKRWPSEHEVAFVRFLARDDILRRGASRGVSGVDSRARLIIFSQKTQGPGIEALISRVQSYREKYNNFNQSLTPMARSNPSATWTKVDLDTLAALEETGGNRWLRVWHDELHMSLVTEKATQPNQLASTSAALVGRSGEAQRHLAAKDTSSQARIEQTPKLKLAQSSDSIADMSHQIEQRSHQLALLEEQGKIHNQLLAQQTELLDGALKQAELQAQTFAKQKDTMDRIERHLESLHELLS